MADLGQYYKLKQEGHLKATNISLVRTSGRGLPTARAEYRAGASNRPHEPVNSSNVDVKLGRVVLPTRLHNRKKQYGPVVDPSYQGAVLLKSAWTYAYRRVPLEVFTPLCHFSSAAVITACARRTGAAVRVGQVQREH